VPMISGDDARASCIRLRRRTDVMAGFPDDEI
jgi:hypothetical protein